MLKDLRARLALIVLAVLVSGWVLYRNYNRPDAAGHPLRQVVNLGLDLQGGTHLAMEIDESKTRLTSAQRADAIDRAIKIVRTRVDELGVTEPIVQKAGNDRIIVELAGKGQDAERAKAVLQRTAFLQFQIVHSLAELQPILPRIDQAVSQAVGTEKTAAAPAAQSPVGGLFKGADSTKAGADTTAKGQPFTSKVQPAGEGELAVANENVAAIERYLALPQVQRLLPRGTELLWGMVQKGEQAQPYRALYLVESRPLITGDYLEQAQAQSDPQTMRPIVVFELSHRGGNIFERGTGANIGKQMAIVLDDKVYSAPVIQSQIGNRGQIDMGSASLEDASDLALVLRAGALPAPLRIAEERTVGPSLGADSISKGTMAGIVGLVLVVVIMIGIYRFAGLLSVLALAVYVLLALAGHAGLGATLTFPGIAGFILSIGMAVDANVLIFERIREELDRGRNVRTAVSEGFTHAMTAIVDSNLTTLITCAILFYTGTGPIRGFAVTLSIGVVASMFTAIFVTRTLLMLYMERSTAAAQRLSI